ncbi:helix-turn-helix domain-containing protein [Rubellicoccus peritrichatus]|uniref:Helix-turn-helix domain-containing protein n=1 Tax=Rubellicoccus peritrichatus TaxID=3080537 RepID=A0AAQ3LJ80_9BACT|nr:helix-turn-helix domain-containing protein [Puniceicoccus sp. CR14]WOO43174.1 helix-turn-helix domain-containing protein [Puniceicoccus sp. CR14]
MKDQYQREIKWSEEDGCFLGRCPDLFLGGCHGDTEEEVREQLDEIIADAIKDYQKKGKPLPEPSKRPARASGALPAREAVGVNQVKFAEAIGVPVATIRNWEQERTKPSGAAKTLLHVLEKHPEITRELVVK